MHEWRKDLPASTGHDLDLARTFALSWDSVNDETAQKLFLMVGYLAPNTPVPLTIFEQALEIASDTCDELLETLYGLGLLRKSDGNEPTIHPLLAEFGRGLAKEQDDILASLSDVLATLSYEANMSGIPAHFIPIRSHVSASAAHTEDANLESAGMLWTNHGYHLKMIADYPGARAAFERALKIDEASFGPDHPNVAIDVNNLGMVMKALGDLPGARAAYERALKIVEASFGPDHPNVAIDVNNLGSVLKALGDLPGARAAYERALKIFEKFLPPDHPNIKIVQENLDSVDKS
jgi:tetratricopeptide (TPR) repeat protein